MLDLCVSCVAFLSFTYCPRCMHAIYEPCEQERIIYSAHLGEG